MKQKKICPICGYPHLKEGPYDEFGCSTFEICPCCGFEFGFDDDSEGYSYDSYREKWIKQGAPWFSDNIENKPYPWDEAALRQQLSNINSVP